ncbi:hypothetical protein [Leptolyngbya sp. NIES-2104]|uniref:hypothetical protein n=1 Tax=Leptolyngbya sp. NIES-2104 TaxID=1552121 RepID=UPI0006EC8438|nr:hypothetical protein [Leptolyngbya sp. NIES-2104]GAP97612.1 hypothetical protein NIES2104_41590 [Leptolyngbya sp. NIES-2104]
MTFVQHLWDLLLFLVVVVGAIPVCLWIVAITTHQSTFRLAHAGLVILTVWCSLQTAIALVLGGLHQLNLSAVILCEILLFSLGCFLLRTTQNKFPRFSLSKTIQSFTLQERIILGAFVVVFLNLIVYAILTPITSYDSLAYHLPAMAKWYQVGHFAVLDEFKLELIGYYPYSWEALCLLFMFPFREDVLVTFPNFVAWLILGGATYLIAQQFSAQRIYSLAAALFVLTLPLLTQLVNSIHVDIQFAAFFLSAFYFLLVWWNSRFVSDFVLAIISTGMMLGIKTSAIPYGVLLVLSIALFPILLPRPAAAWFVHLNRFSKGFAWLGSAIALLLGSFWYLKNFLSIGNPVGLLRVQIAGIQLFPGTVDPSKVKITTLAAAFRWLNPSDWLVVIKQVILQFGVPFGLIGLQLVICAVIMALRPQDFKKATMLPGMLIVAIVILYVYTPYSGSNEFPPRVTNWMGQGLRYGFAGVALLGVLSAVGSTIANFRKPLITAGCVLSSVTVLVNIWV